MKPYQKEFLEFSLSIGAIEFSKRELKSGRISSYFFNTGLFSDGMSIDRLGQYYADAIASSDVKIDMLFGPAYKGIPLAVITAAKLHSAYDRNVNYAFDRKEEKDHGEGGRIVGAAMKGNIVVIDDVTTNGDTKKEAVEMTQKNGGIVSAIALAFDRQERAEGELSAVQELERDLKIPIITIATLENLIEHMQDVGTYDEELTAIKEYQKEYGVSNNH